jgi:hypothetical protein
MLAALAATAGPAAAASFKFSVHPAIETTGAVPASHRACGLRIDGWGPAARCPRYEQTCLRDGNAEGLCSERRNACIACGAVFARCESRVGHLRGLLGSCERCVAQFKQCTRTYERRLPIKRP